MPRRAGVISIDINAGTARALLDLDKVSGKLREVGAAGHGSVSGVQATSGALRVLEGNITNNLRASERFIANVLHLGPVLQAAFPVIGAIAFTGILTELGKKVYNFFRGMEEAPGRIGNAFRELNAPIRVANDELLVTKDRLENDIAKLEGRRPNTIALALDQARLAADKLSESLENDIKKLDELMNKNKIGGLDEFLGMASTGADEDESKLFSARIRSILDRGTNKASSAGTPAEAKFERQATAAAVLSALDAQISRQKELIAQSEKLRTLREQQVKNPYRSSYGVGSSVSIPDQSGVLAERTGYLANLEQVRNRFAVSGDIANLEERKAGLEQGSEAAKKYAEELKRLQEQLARVRAEQLTGLQRVAEEERNEQIRLQDAGQLNSVTLGLVTKIYDTKRLTVYTELTEKLNNELAETGIRWQHLSTEAGKVGDEFLSKEIEAGTKTLEEHAKAVTKLAEEYANLTQQAGTQATQHQVNMVTAGGTHGDPLAALARQQAIERSDIEQRYQNSLKQINETLTGADQLLARANLEKERAIQLTKLQNELEEKTAEIRQKGVSDFFKDMQGQAQTAGNILYESMHDGLNRVSDELAKLFTGQKTSFGKMLQEIGQSLVRQSIKSALQRGLGELGKVLGIHPPPGKPDGTPGNPYHVIVDNQQGQAGSGSAPVSVGSSVPSAFNSGAISGAVSGGISALPGLLKGLFAGSTPSVTSTFIPALAGGGDVDPGSAYWVGDGGEPELFTPKSSGRITPASKMGGDTHNYTIDARGAQLGVENRIAAAIDQAHRSAVATSVRSSIERSKRVPRGS